MKRSELREHIFRMIFGYEFNSDAEMPEQMQLYFEQLDEEDAVKAPSLADAANSAAVLLLMIEK